MAIRCFLTEPTGGADGLFFRHAAAFKSATFKSN
jgi:hypothetical protein